MHDIFKYGLSNILMIKVSGKNTNRFITKLIQNKIALLDISNIDRKEIYIKIYEKDLKKVEGLKTIYSINIRRVYGFLYIKQVVKYYKVLLISIIICTIIFLFSIRIITKVEVIHNDSDIRQLLLNETKKRGIKKFGLRKSYEEIEKIKVDILDKKRNDIEWIEIERVGTKYIIRVEERKLNKSKKEEEKVNIVAKKSSIIKLIEAKEGVVSKEINSYVKKGDVIISGEVYLNEELKNIGTAKGKVYGEVWYKTTVEYPFLYKAKNYTGNKKTIYSLKFLNNKFDLSFRKKYKDYESKETPILSHLFFPIRLQKEIRKEVVKTDDIYTIDEAIKQANITANKKIEENLNGKEKIISSKNLKVSVKDSKIILEVFFTVFEDITDTVIINEEELLNNKKKEDNIKE